jgi:hypothetical protein
MAIRPLGLFGPELEPFVREILSPQKMPSTTKIAITTTCVILNGGSDCVGAIALSAGTFSKSWTTKTKTFR